MRISLMSWLNLALALSILSACSHEPIRDMTFYGDKGKFGATAVHSIHKNIPPQAIPKAQWDTMRIGMVCTDGVNISWALATIDRLCARLPRTCRYEEAEKIKAALAYVRRAAKLNRELAFYVDDFAYRDFGVYDLRDFEVAHSLGPDQEVLEHDEIQAP